MSGNWNIWRRTMKKNWPIDKNASDWECDPKGEELFHLRYFRALPMEKKIQAVEEMCALASMLKEQRENHRVKRNRKPVK
jgi:hypothetical protein